MGLEFLLSSSFVLLAFTSAGLLYGRLDTHSDVSLSDNDGEKCTTRMIFGKFWFLTDPWLLAVKYCNSINLAITRYNCFHYLNTFWTGLNGTPRINQLEKCGSGDFDFDVGRGVIQNILQSFSLFSRWKGFWYFDEILWNLCPSAMSSSFDTYVLKILRQMILRPAWCCLLTFQFVREHRGHTLLLMRLIQSLNKMGKYGTEKSYSKCWFTVLSILCERLNILYLCL